MNRKAVSGSLVALLLMSALTLAFSIQPVKATGTIYIRPDGSIDPPLAPIQRVGDTYFLMWHANSSLVVERSNITVDGNGYVLQGSGTGKGIDLAATSNVTIQNIEVRTFGFGIWLYKPFQSSNSKILSSIVANNTYGIWIFASNNTLSRNTIIDSSHSGIVIDIDSTNNTITENSIADNTRGVWIITASNNRFYHNNFIYNTQQAHIPISGYPNVWDDGYPSGGNYWSDYSGIDFYRGPYQNITGSDGIGDTPYTIDGSNEDNYPLITPWPLISVQSHIHFDLEPHPAFVGQTIMLQGNLTTSDNLPIPYEQVILRSNGTIVTTLATNSNGWFGASGRAGSAGTFNITAEYEGSSQYLPSSDWEILTVTKSYTWIYAGFKPNPVDSGESCELRGVLLGQFTNPVKFATIVYQYSVDYGQTWSRTRTLVTDSHGVFSKVFTAPLLGIYLVRMIYAGSSNYEPSTVSIPLIVH